MFRGVATALVAMATFDLYVLDGRYINAFQMIGRSLAPFLWILGRYYAPCSSDLLRSACDAFARHSCASCS